MKTLLKSTSVAILVTLVTLASGQESRIYREGGSWGQEVTGNLASAKILRVRLDSGSVRVQGDSASGISYSLRRHAFTASEERARREFDSSKFSAVVKGDTAWIVAESERRQNRKCSGEFVVHVPRNLELAKLETDGGGVTVTGVAGRIELQSGGGNVHLDNIGGAIVAETGGGTIEVGNVFNDINVHTGGGNIKIGSVKGKIVAETGGGSVVITSSGQGATVDTGAGNIRVEKCQGMLRVSTGGGSVDLGNVDGATEIETGGGSIRLNWAKGPVKAETGGGTIELMGVSSARAETGGGGIVAKFVSAGEKNDSWLETTAGDITVYVANDLAISIRAAIEAANGHTIHSDFGDIHVNVEGGNWGPRTVTAEGNLNGGGPILKVRTSTGNISFLRISQ